jgi:hypothetical protein
MKTPNPNETPRSGHLWPVLLGLGALALMVWLREDPGFWKQPDPSTAWTRPLVQFGYYPTILLVGSAIVRMVFVCERNQRGNAWIKLWAASVTLCFILIYGFSNNIINYLDGRPVHYHVPMATQGFDAAAP